MADGGIDTRSNDVGDATYRAVRLLLRGHLALPWLLPGADHP